MTGAGNSGAIFQILLATTLVRYGDAYAEPRGDPGPWDWQNSDAQYPVFNTYPRYNTMTPEFLKLNKNVTVIEGETAHLPCRVKNLGEQYTVSWIRRRDVTVLSVGHLAFSSDQRFSVIQVPRTRISAGDWTLQILDSTTSDSGLYECQVNSEPKISQNIRLHVQGIEKFMQNDEGAVKSSEQKMSSSKYRKINKIEDSQVYMFMQDTGCLCPVPTNGNKPRRKTGQGPLASISGGPLQHVSVGSTVGLECTVSHLPSAPSTLHWTKEGQILTAKDRSGVSIEAEKLPGVSTTRLFLSGAKLTDTGNYSCNADDDATASVLVVVNKGASASALTADPSSAMTTYSALLTSALLIIWILQLLM